MNKIRIFAFADEASPFIDEQIKAMRRNGLNGLEIRNVDKTNVSEITLQKAKEVKAKLDDSGLITWSIGSPIGKIDIEKDDFEAEKEKLKHTLEIAKILDAENIRMFSFFIPSEKNADLYRNEVIDRLGAYADIVNGSGVTLCHENEKGIYGDTADRCLEILKAVPSLQGIFDPANFVQCGQDTAVAWRQLKPYIKYMHIKDALTDGSVVPAGKGYGNVELIAKDFIGSGGKEFTIEPHLKVFAGLAELEQDASEIKVGTKFTYSSNDEAFDVACTTFKAILEV